jgi:integrase
MPKVATQKAETVFRNAKAKDKAYLIADGDGLCLQVSPEGVKRWIFRYRFDGKERKIALKDNLYPAMSAKLAREGADRLREMVARGDDPGEVRKIAKIERVQLVAEVRKEEAKLANTFRLVAEEWMETILAARTTSTRTSTAQRFERNVFPWIGDRPISEITAPELLEVVRKIERNGKQEMAHRVLRRCGQVFRYAIATGRAPRDIASDLKGALAPAQGGHRAAITDPAQFGQLLREIDNYQGYYATHYALRLLPLVFTRPGELRLAKWEEIDFERAQWDIPAGRMKMRLPHTVPLSRQALEILKDLHALSGSGPVLFPTPRQKDKPISDVAILNGLRRMSYAKDEQSAHGFRASARTLLDERLGVNPAHIEAQLAHKVAGPLGTAYNRTQFLDARKDMMQTWADYLDTLKA